jgi:oligoendopeptidase F
MSVKQQVILPVKPERRFLPKDLVVSSWENIKPFFGKLLDRKITSVSELEAWLFDLSELESVFSEAMAWRYIHMTCDTTNTEYVNAYNYFVTEIEPKAAPYFNDFHKKLISSPFLAELDTEKYRTYLRYVKQSLEIYRDENIPLFTEIDGFRQEYTRIVSEMTVTLNDSEITLQQAANILKDTDRNVREQTYHKIVDRRLKDCDTLEGLFDSLRALRHRVALNAGFKNYRDYMFASLGRFDYTPDDCFRFHDAVASEIVPVLNQFDEDRKKALKLDALRAWDMEVDVSGLPALSPFENAKELVEKTILCFRQIKPAFGDYIEIMNRMGHFDLDSRKGKAPGGYNYPMYEIGVPFIFMNSVGSSRDLVTMVHEGGHAIHSFLTRDLPLTENKSVPSEVAELASMSMELISMEHWEVFFKNPDDLKRAKKEQMEKALRSLSWISLIDKFQHWVYEHPEHTREERKATWKQFSAQFSSAAIDWTGLEHDKDYDWHRQLHVFELPFYYIEYGFAQLGALAMWRNYKQDPEKAIKNYEHALGLGYTKSIGELYDAAGIRFDFSQAYVKELVTFVKSQIALLD